MLFLVNILFNKLTRSLGFKGLFVITFGVFLAESAMSQGTQGLSRESTANAVICFKSYIKEPITFYGNPMEIFTLNDGTKWKVSSSGSYEYIPVRYRNVLICPSEDLLVVDKRAIPVLRVN